MSIEYDVRQFMAAAQDRDTADLTDKQRGELRISLLDEQYDELVQAIQWGDKQIIAKKVADLVYVAVSVDVELGIPFSEVWDIVHESNMSNFAEEIEPMFNISGKLIKAPSYIDPSEKIAKIVKP